MNRLNSTFRAVLFSCGILAQTSFGASNTVTLGYAPAPPGNPLKGFFPYTGMYTTFPYSMEWDYLPLRALMTGPTSFNWSALDSLLDDVAGRGHQAIFRIYLDVPTLPTGIPQYLLEAGLVTRRYDEHENNGISVSPDYENPLLRQALTNFIAALGARYDGDPRIGFITVGLLGFWGEWHTYLHEEWFASVTVQNEVLNAYEAGFKKTKFLLRQPFGTNPAGRRMGYHDDSFAYETIDPPEWHFLGALKAAGETNKWRTQPIGGEVRPSVQCCMWDTNMVACVDRQGSDDCEAVPANQEFTNCVRLAHASWMLNHALFEPGFTGISKDRALAGARMLGYELYVTNAQLVDPRVSGSLTASIWIRNLGVAPFYYDWPVQLRALNASNQIAQTWNTPWRLSSLLPSTTNSIWSITTNHVLAAGQYKLLLRVQNPLSNGIPFRFANSAQDSDAVGWLTLGQFSVLNSPPPPRLQGVVTNAAFRLQVTGSAPGTWIVQGTSNFATWYQLWVTNTSASNWNFIESISSGIRFYRVQAEP